MALATEDREDEGIGARQARDRLQRQSARQSRRQRRRSRKCQNVTRTLCDQR